jgi:hypothetical protein
MTFIMSGQFFSLAALSPSMDEAFQRLHAAFLSSATYDPREFAGEAAHFFDCCPRDLTKHDTFFNNFTLIWRRLVSSGNLQSAEQIWELAVAVAKSWEASRPNARIHKGTPYYFWGMTSILRGDLDRGYAFMHQAVEEDVTAHNTQFPDTPAFAFATLNSQKIDQAFRSWVLQKARLVIALLKQYCSATCRTFDLDHFQQKFLFHPPNRDTAFLFAYVLGRLVKLNDIPDYAKRNGFTSQIELNLLFDLSLVIDAAIAPRDSTHWKFIDFASFLCVRCQINLTKRQLIEANSAFKREFAGAINAVVGNTFTFADGSKPDPLASDIILAYGIRNFGAHHIQSIATVRQQFAQLLQSLFNMLFLTADHLY